MRQTVPGELHGLVAPGMRAALPSGTVGDADAALHGSIVAILMRALAIHALGLRPNYFRCHHSRHRCRRSW